MLKINVNTVPDGATMYVRGVVEYSIITKRLEGAELDADNARKSQFGMMAESKPHSRLTISQASVVYADPANPTIGEQFISQKFYESKKAPGKKAMFNAVNKSYSLPDIYARDDSDPTKLIPTCLDAELAAGMKVTLLMRIFPTKMNKGVSLDAVICDEPIRYVGGAGATSGALSAAGFTVAAASPETIAAYQERFRENNAPAAVSVPPAVSAAHIPPVIPQTAADTVYASYRVPPALSPPAPPAYLATAPAPA